MLANFDCEAFQRGFFRDLCLRAVTDADRAEQPRPWRFTDCILHFLAISGQDQRREHGQCGESLHEEGSHGVELMCERLIRTSWAGELSYSWDLLLPWLLAGAA